MTSKLLQKIGYGLSLLGLAGSLYGLSSCLNDNQSHSIKKEEFQSFENIAELKEGLRKTGLMSFDEIERDVKHEKAHHDKAVELGYDVEYRVYLDDGKVTPGTYIYGFFPSCEDRVKIALAPENPTLYDLNIVSRCGGKLK